ncbi:MAG: cobalamin-dependent protein [Chloroflexales bacterium]
MNHSDSSPHDLDSALMKVDATACESYRSHVPLMIAYANQQIAKRTTLTDLLGACPINLIYNLHADHAHLIAAQLQIKSGSTLIATIIREYELFLPYGISLDFFLSDFAVWMEATNQYLEARSAAQINAVYQQLCDLHPQLMLQARSPQTQPNIADDLRPYFTQYLQALLKPDMAAAIRVTGEYVKNPQQLAIWWEGIIYPAMHEIGRLWADGEISVGQEHLATAITQRVMAIYYPLILDLPRQKGSIVVASSPGELHEIGSRMLSDMLELNGWDAYCTGANTPKESIIELLRQTGSRFLCISTTLAHSLPGVKLLITAVRNANISPTPKIIVGGQAYISDPTTWRQVGADHYALNAHDGVLQIDSLS